MSRNFALSLIALMLIVAAICTVALSAPVASDHQPPRFLPAVVLYDKDDRFVAIEVGKTFSFTCKGALDDAQGSIERAAAVGRRLVGLCIPVPTYAAADLLQ